MNVPPGLDATEPGRPAELAETSESALEFARYFALLVQYVIETRNAGALNAEAFDKTGCTSCVAVTKLVSELKRTRYWQRSKPVELGTFRPVQMGGGFRVSGPLVYPEVEDVRVNGKVVKTVPAEQYRYSVDLKWNKQTGTWQVLDFIYAKKKG